jgi:putative SOS response-associated peptidase YedK
MCGRASLTVNEKELEDRFGSKFYTEDIERYNPVPNYNLAPGQYFPVITNENPAYFHVFLWGLVPFWAKDPDVGYKMINARAETLERNNAFKGAFFRRRCLVPLDGFYEWKKINKIKKPYRIVKSDKSIFSVAGLWDSWVGDGGEIINSFTMVTVPANSLVKKIHNRMPAILFEDEERIWIDKNISHIEARKLLKPFPSELLYAYQVSLKVNNVRNNSADLIKEIPGDKYYHGNLF